MTSFMTEDFLLDTEFARRLYHDYAKDQPLFDYHCHLPPQQVAENYRFKNLYDKPTAEPACKSAAGATS